MVILAGYAGKLDALFDVNQDFAPDLIRSVWNSHHGLRNGHRYDLIIIVSAFYLHITIFPQLVIPLSL